ncbi:uncharacterized protein LOC142320058 [Lycorma delicatula]|uniref:uncharacterized protein LOC142320058 n=1 Tax=Lycorma delicatula TaxID=130591 RepID=UPI003F51AB9A
MEKWGVTNKTRALCCDTTASNTSRIHGACKNLERLFNRGLLYLSCRHHIFELVLKSSPDVRSTILGFLEHHLSMQKQQRDDYREVIELTMFFLGVIQKNGISFLIPGAVSHARWMTKAMYTFKIYMF